MKTLHFVAIGWATIILFSGCGQSGPVTRLTATPASAMLRVGGPSGVVPEPLPAGQPYRISMAMNEGESFQVRLQRPTGQAGQPGAGQRLFRVKTQIQPVTGPAGMLQQFTPPAITSYQVLDVYYPGPPDNPTWKIPPRNIGWIPDICWPTQVAIAQSHKPDELTMLFDFRTPPGPAPERPVWLTYRLSFTALPADDVAPASAPAAAESVSLDVELRILPFAIPTRLPFRTSVTWDWGVEKFLGRKLSPADRLAYFDFFLDYRLTPAMFWSAGPAMSEEELAHVVARGGNVFQLYGRGSKNPPTDADKKRLEPQLTQWREMMKRAGAIDFCYALVADEPEEKVFPNIRAWAVWLKSVFPELKIWVATKPCLELLDVVDCWDVVTAASGKFYAKHNHTPEGLALARSAANHPEYWWFYSVEPYAPHPNARLDDTLADSRAIGWMSFAAGVDGYEYFWATDWAENAVLRGVPYPQRASQWATGLAGAGVLCYPGEDGRPMPSLRLINLRDAMEDWAVFTQAGAALKRLAGPEVRHPDELYRLRDRANDMVPKRHYGQ